MHLLVAAEQCDIGDWFFQQLRARTKSFDVHGGRGRSHHNCIECPVLSDREPNILWRERLSLALIEALGLQLGAAARGTFAEDFPWPRRKDRLAIDVHP